MRRLLALSLLVFATSSAAAADVSSTVQLHDLTRDGAFFGCHVVTESYTTYRLTVNQGDTVTFNVLAPANNTNVHTFEVEGGPPSDQVAAGRSTSVTYIATRPGNVALLCDGKQDSLSGTLTVRAGSTASGDNGSPSLGFVGIVLVLAFVAYRRRA